MATMATMAGRELCEVVKVFLLEALIAIQLCAAEPHSVFLEGTQIAGENESPVTAFLNCRMLLLRGTF